MNLSAFSEKDVAMVHLGNCKNSDVEAVLDFMYRGELDFDSFDKQKVLQIAQICKITSLETYLNNDLDDCSVMCTEKRSYDLLSHAKNCENLETFKTSQKRRFELLNKQKESSCDTVEQSGLDVSIKIECGEYDTCNSIKLASRKDVQLIENLVHNGASFTNSVTTSDPNDTEIQANSYQSNKTSSEIWRSVALKNKYPWNESTTPMNDLSPIEATTATFELEPVSTNLAHREPVNVLNSGKSEVSANAAIFTEYLTEYQSLVLRNQNGHCASIPMPSSPPIACQAPQHNLPVRVPSSLETLTANFCAQHSVVSCCCGSNSNSTAQDKRSSALVKPLTATTIGSFDQGLSQKNNPYTTTYSSLSVNAEPVAIKNVQDLNTKSELRKKRYSDGQIPLLRRMEERSDQGTSLCRSVDDMSEILSKAGIYSNWKVFTTEPNTTVAQKSAFASTLPTAITVSPAVVSSIIPKKRPYSAVPENTSLEGTPHQNITPSCSILSSDQQAAIASLESAETDSNEKLQLEKIVDDNGELLYRRKQRWEAKGYAGSDCHLDKINDPIDNLKISSYSENYLKSISQFDSLATQHSGRKRSITPPPNCLLKKYPLVVIPNISIETEPNTNQPLAHSDLLKSSENQNYVAVSPTTALQNPGELSNLDNHFTHILSPKARRPSGNLLGIPRLTDSNIIPTSLYQLSPTTEALSYDKALGSAFNLTKPNEKVNGQNKEWKSFQQTSVKNARKKKWKEF